MFVLQQAIDQRQKAENGPSYSLPFRRFCAFPLFAFPFRAAIRQCGRRLPPVRVEADNDVECNLQATIVRGIRAEQKKWANGAGEGGGEGVICRFANG